MADDKDLIVGAFYWIMYANDPDIEEAWEYYTQPGRFYGHDENGHPMWQSINMEGPTTWSVRWVGPRIIAPDGEEERLAKGNDPPEWKT